jgi:hypothetical protein
LTGLEFGETLQIKHERKNLSDIGKRFLRSQPHQKAIVIQSINGEPDIAALLASV